SKVESTYDYNRQGEDRGHIQDVVIDKRSGQVAYAFMSFGGFLGMGVSYHPLPGEILAHDTRVGGYVVLLDKVRRTGAAAYISTGRPDWRDRDYTGRIDTYYGVPPYSGWV